MHPHRIIILWMDGGSVRSRLGGVGVARTMGTVALGIQCVMALKEQIFYVTESQSMSVVRQ